MTRHWVEVYPDGGRIAARLVCEHPTDCQDTREQDRARGCNVVEWLDATSLSDLLHWPAGEHPVIGRLEVAAHWEGRGVFAGLTLVPPAECDGSLAGRLDTTGDEPGDGIAMLAAREIRAAVDGGDHA